MEPAELLALRQHVPDLIEATGPQGSIIVAPGLQGRIFCTIEGMMVHRLDAALLAKPHAEEFNNFGGNSLWPAPEGGPFALNYLPGAAWSVQEGVNKVNMKVAKRMPKKQPTFLELAKKVKLTNRRGTQIKLAFRRDVLLNPDPVTVKIGKSTSIQYCTTDTLEPLGNYSPDEALFAPWSLEQFPLSDDVIVFAQVSDPRTALNFDYYGTPAVTPIFGEKGLALRLGGPDKFQIGLKAQNQPQMIGALDRRRELLILRASPAVGFHEAAMEYVENLKGDERGAKGETAKKTIRGSSPCRSSPFATRPSISDARYFNIADNDQPAGPWSAADMYSIFYGAGLGFYELETIAPARIEDNRLLASLLTSATFIRHGDLGALEQHVAKMLGLPVSALNGI
jgi:hypothetical protein